MAEKILTILYGFAAKPIVIIIIVAVVMDTFFGVLRALKQHKFNSSVGIDGAIRKISMLISLAFLGIFDNLMHINLIGFIPSEVRSYFPQSVSVIGLVEFFGLLYAGYELVSILKNMALCGLPVRKLWEAVCKFLRKYTEELPDMEENDEQTAEQTEKDAETETDVEVNTEGEG